MQGNRFIQRRAWAAAAATPQQRGPIDGPDRGVGEPSGPGPPPQVGSTDVEIPGGYRRSRASARTATAGRTTRLAVGRRARNGAALARRAASTGRRRCLSRGLYRNGVQFCSGVVDFVVCVGGHGGGAHRLALAGERFVGLVAEDLAEVGDGFQGCDCARSTDAVLGLAYIASAFLSEASATTLSRSENSGVSELSEPEGGHPA